MKRLVKIDTNGSNWKGEFNEQLFNLITPRIESLVLYTGEIYENIDWQKTLESKPNLHCVYQKNDKEYTSAEEFQGFIINLEGWEEILPYEKTISDICDTLAEYYEIEDWN